MVAALDVARLALLSAAAYCPPRDLAAWTCGACVRLPAAARVRATGNTSWDLLAFVASFDGGLTTLSFRGTNPEDVANVLLDLDWSLAPLPYAGCSGCAVHAGFYAGWAALAGGVLAALSDVAGGAAAAAAAPVVITGHSLGGALATLAAYELTLAGYVVAGVTTFGSPRVGNARFAASFHAVVHERDASSVTLGEVLAPAANDDAAPPPPSPPSSPARARALQLHRLQLLAARRRPRRRGGDGAAVRTVASGRLRNGLPTLYAPPAPASQVAVAPSAVLRLAADKAGCGSSHGGVAAACARPPALAAVADAGGRVSSPPSSSSPASSPPPRAPLLARRVHDADMVPHLPPRVFGYAHPPREVWARPCAAWGPAANATGSVTGCASGDSGAGIREGSLLCSASDGEDAACSRVLSLPSIADHLQYEGLPITRLC